MDLVVLEQVREAIICNLVDVALNSIRTLSLGGMYVEVT